MIGVVFGLACGAVEFLLLLRLANTITRGRSIPFWILPAKIGALALFFLPVGFIRPGELYLAGIGAVAVLVAGALFRLLINKKRKNDQQAAPSEQERIL